MLHEGETELFVDSISSDRLFSSIYTFFINTSQMRYVKCTKKTLTTTHAHSV